MPKFKRPPGQIRDSIISYLVQQEQGASLNKIREHVKNELSGNVSDSSIRSYLRLNTPSIFERTKRGYYKIK